MSICGWRGQRVRRSLGGCAGRASERWRAAGNAGGERGAGGGRTGGESARRGEPGPGVEEPSRAGGEDAGGGTGAAAGWLRGGLARRIITPRPSPRTRTQTHTRSLTRSDSAHFPQNNGFKLRQLKKKKIPTLDLEERREGRGSVSWKGKSCQSHLSRRLPESIVVEGMGFSRSSRLDICGGNPGSHPPPANQPLENAPRFPLSEPLPRGSTPCNTFQVSPHRLPSLLPRPEPGGWVGVECF